jgi:hypothetical protein
LEFNYNLGFSLLTKACSIRKKLIIYLVLESATANPAYIPTATWTCAVSSTGFKLTSPVGIKTMITGTPSTWTTELFIFKVKVTTTTALTVA